MGTRHQLRAEIELISASRSETTEPIYDVRKTAFPPVQGGNSAHSLPSTDGRVVAHNPIGLRQKLRD